MTQVVASVLATVTATVALSLLGVAGTILGAAVASVVTVLGNAVYAASIRSTRQGVMAFRRTASSHTGAGAAASAVLGAPSRLHRVGRRRRALARLGHTRTLVAAMIAVFVAILALITVVELVSGHPLAATVRGRPAGGTSLFGVTTSTTAPSPTAPVSSGLVSSPQSAVSTPAESSTAEPTGSSTALPTGSSTVSTSASSSTSPTSPASSPSGLSSPGSS